MHVCACASVCRHVCVCMYLCTHVCCHPSSPSVAAAFIFCYWSEVHRLHWPALRGGEEKGQTRQTERQKEGKECMFKQKDRHWEKRIEQRHNQMQPVARDREGYRRTAGKLETWYQELRKKTELLTVCQWARLYESHGIRGASTSVLWVHGAVVMTGKITNGFALLGVNA